MVARAWRTRVASLDLPVAAGAGPIAVPPIPDGDRRGTYRLAMWNRGYADAIDWRFVTGSEEGGGPVAVWARQRIDLVAGEPPSPLSRLLLLSARTVVEPTGRGMTETELFDADGRLGRATQALVVGPC